MNINTNEPIVITASSIQGDTLIQITDDTGTYDYAIMLGINPSDIDTDRIADWVNNTYYDLDYRCSSYTPSYLK